ncbi:MAG: transglutaminase family protein [Bacteroidia bacterium]|nr:transglutaminase family protein [Bacteroidia bacterium]
MIESGKIIALISLLDDPDKAVWESAFNELTNIEFEHIHVLYDYLEQGTETAEQHERLEACIDKVRHEHIGNQLLKWKNDGGKKLLSAMALICQLRYPEITEEDLHEKLETLRLDAWLEFHYDLTSFEKVKILNYILFQLHGFRGDETNFMHHDNSFINKVLESKKGNPISLSIIYILVAQRLNVPVYGINLPKHFIMAYIEDEETGNLENFNDLQDIGHKAEGEIKFYINAYNGGGVFNLEQLRGIMMEMELEEKPEYINPCSNSDIALRVLMNLHNSYKHQEKPESSYIDAIIQKFIKS